MFPIPSLYQLSAHSVANYFIDGRYNHLDFVLNSKFSDTIFEILKDNEKIDSTDILNQLSKKFTSSKMDLTKMPMSSEATKMLSTQYLESISFGPISFKNINHNIVSLIRGSLNGVSRRQLKTLKIHGISYFGKESKRFFQLSRLLPHLETLDLSGSKITKLGFLSICHNFLNLKILNIGGAINVEGAVIDLTGIPSLKNLEVLILSGLRLFSHEDLEELFSLKNLKMLDISSCGENIMEKYLECGKVLEELQFLDCSGTDIDKIMVEKLIETHKNLKQMAVLNTIIDFSVFPGINLLNCGTAESILKALDYYTKLGSRSIITHILDHIHSDYLQLFDKEKHGHLLEKFLKSVCTTIKEFEEDKDVCENGMLCLADIGKKTVVKLLHPSSRYYLINQLLELGSKWLKSTSGQAHSLFIRALDEPLVLEQILPSKVRKLCEYVINYLAHFYHVPNNALLLLEKLWKTLSPSEELELLKISGFERYLISFFHHSVTNTYEYLETHRKDLGVILDLFCEMSDRNAGAFLPKPLFDFFKKYPSEWEERSKFIEIMANVIRNNRFRYEYSQLYLNERDFFIELLDIKTNGADLVFHAMTVLSLTMMSSMAPLKSEEYWQSTSEKMMRIGRNFPIHQVSPRVFEPFLRDNILRDVLQKSKLEKGGAVMWALVIIQGILMDKNEKNKEILENKGLFNVLQGVKAKGIGKYGKKIAGLSMNT